MINEQSLGSLDHIIKKGIKTKGEFQITDALQEMINRGSAFVPFRTPPWRPLPIIEGTSAEVEASSSGRKGGVRNGTKAAVFQLSVPSAASAPSTAAT